MVIGRRWQRVTGDGAGAWHVAARRRCGLECGDPLVITTRAADGSRVSLWACTGCGARSWTRDGEDVALEDLLGDLGRSPVALLRAG
jgi:hypothetical protein